MSAPDPEIESLLAAERTRPEPDDAVKAAVAAQVAAALGAGAIGTVAGAGAIASAGSKVGSAAAAGTSVALKVALGVIAGGLLGGTIVAAALPPKVVVQTREVRVEVPVASAAPSGTLELPTATLVTSAQAPRATLSAPPARTAPTTSAGRDVDLSRERALVDRARSALARGDAAGALAAADEHRKAFAGGQLAEEREVVAIQALAAAGRPEEAANRAGSFRKTYPSSLLLPIVDAALRPR